jgi:NAD(P)H-flavin reductase
MSPQLAALSTADIVHFHGPFHTPIQHEVRADAEQIVLISTGVGIGPLYGYTEKALNDGERRPITLLAGFREQSHTCMASDLEVLARRHSNFSWRFTLSRPTGSWVGLRGRVTDCLSETIDVEKLSTCHFHLVGNGEMVHLLRRALTSAGVSPERVSIETYFNHYVKPSKEEIERVAAPLIVIG